MAEAAATAAAAVCTSRPAAAATCGTARDADWAAFRAAFRTVAGEIAVAMAGAAALEAIRQLERLFRAPDEALVSLGS